MKEKIKVILDWDDTLCECNSYLLELLNIHRKTDYKLSDITSWGPSKDSVLNGRFSYMDTEFFHNTAPMMPGAKTFMQSLFDMNCEVFIMTAVKGSQMGWRIARIMREFPFFKPENIIMGARKDLINADFMLDDGPHNIENSNVTYPVLFRKPWNADKTGLMAVSDYEGFLSIIRSVTEDRTGNHNGPVVLVGPSGSGKTTIASYLLSEDHFEMVTSYTTRQRRESESLNAYHFISPREFDLMDAEDMFVEKSSYANCQYGSSKKDIDDIIHKGKLPVMILDICGAMSVKHYYPNASLFFIERCKDECFRAVLERNLSIDETVTRLSSYDVEMKNKQFCDFSIKNCGDIENAIKFIKERVQ